MAIIHQPGLFSGEQVDAASDTDRLRRVLEALPDEALMLALEVERKGRRDDYPLRASGTAWWRESSSSMPACRACGGK